MIDEQVARLRGILTVDGHWQSAISNADLEALLDRFDAAEAVCKEADTFAITYLHSRLRRAVEAWKKSRTE